MTPPAAPGAAEALHLSLRDRLVMKLDGARKTPPADLTTWVIARVLRSMEQLLDLGVWVMASY